MKYDVFISYSRKDTKTVMIIVELLKAKGINVWIDYDGIYTGDAFKRTIVSAIKESKEFIFFSSEASNQSEWTTKEVGVAVALKKKIIPIKLDKSEYSSDILFDLVNLDFLEARTSDIDEVVKRLISSIKKDMGDPIDHYTIKELAKESKSSITLIRNQNRFMVNGVDFDMVEVEGGIFQMGAIDFDAYNIIEPIHRESISNFCIGKTVVTNALWNAVMGSSIQGDNLPMKQVSWNDCMIFIRKLNSLTGENFRLPTEAEWEYAARGGSKSLGYKYSGSNNIGEVAWYGENSGNKTHPVATKSPNELGLYDMSGNVWEWTSDFWRSVYDSNRTCIRRVGRGGCWSDDEKSCRVSSRSCGNPSITFCGFGFRLAL